jgi:hypothetical protein
MPMAAARGRPYDGGMDLFDYALAQALRKYTGVEFTAWLERQRGPDWSLEDEAELQTRIALLRARASSRLALPAGGRTPAPDHH